MLYVKSQDENVSIAISIDEENVFTHCARCGREIPVDLVEHLKSDDGDLYSTNFFCGVCSEEELRNSRYNPT